MSHAQSNHCGAAKGLAAPSVPLQGDTTVGYASRVPKEHPEMVEVPSLEQRTSHKKGPRTRRVVASISRIEGTITAGQRQGLTATSVSHYPDGRVVVHFGEPVEQEATIQDTGWEDI